MTVTEPTESFLAEYDYLDIGSSKGGSIDFAMGQLGGKRGLGVDIDPANIAYLRRRGYDCIQGDIAEMTFPAKSVRFAQTVDALQSATLPRDCLLGSTTRPSVLDGAPWRSPRVRGHRRYANGIDRHRLGLDLVRVGIAAGFLASLTAQPPSMRSA